MNKWSNLNAYDVGRQIGKGGFSRVFIARDRKSKKQVALKFIRINSLSPDGSTRSKMLERELEIHQLVSNHPRIISVFATLKLNSQSSCVVLEVAQGDLRQVVVSRLRAQRDGGKIPLPIVQEGEIHSVLRQLLEGVAFLHERGIVHRDIKTNNVLFVQSPDKAFSHCKSKVSTHTRSIALSTFSENQKAGVDLELCRIMLSDFGLATKMKEGMDWDFCQQTMCGTVSCLAPEIARNVRGKKFPNVSTAMEVSGHGRPVDLWMTGCSIYYLLVGKYPFSKSLHDEDIDVINRILSEPWSLPQAVLVSDSLIELLKTLLSKSFRCRGQAKSLLAHSPFLSFDLAVHAKIFHREMTPLSMKEQNDSSVATVRPNEDDNREILPTSRQFAEAQDKLPCNEMNSFTILLYLYGPKRRNKKFAKVKMKAQYNMFPIVKASFLTGAQIRYEMCSGKFSLRDKKQDVSEEFDAQLYDHGSAAGSSKFASMDSWLTPKYLTLASLLSRYEIEVSTVLEATAFCQIKLREIECRTVHQDCATNSVAQISMLMNGSHRNTWTQLLSQKSKGKLV